MQLGKLLLRLDAWKGLELYLYCIIFSQISVLTWYWFSSYPPPNLSGSGEPMQWYTCNLKLGTEGIDIDPGVLQNFAMLSVLYFTRLTFNVIFFLSLRDWQLLIWSYCLLIFLFPQICTQKQSKPHSPNTKKERCRCLPSGALCLFIHH